MIGETIGAYRIVSELGRGAVGVVYLAQHRHLSRQVAIKFLQSELSDRTDLVQRFFTEARAASMIEHEGIVRVLDCDVHRTGHAYIVMEYLVGDTLREYLTRRRQLPISEAASIMIRVADALAAAHAMGIVHRDLKPDNIFVLAQPIGAVKIVDFGIAKLTRPGSSPVSTLTGALMGTPLYMSPEQARGVATLDGRSDVYALGCILFELLCGRPPFVYGDSEALLSAHLNEPAPTAQSLDPSIPGSLSLLLEKMLAKSPDQRARLAEEVIPTLASVLTGRATLPREAQAGSRPPQRWRTGTSIALAIAGAAALGGGVWLFRAQNPPPPPTRLAASPPPADFWGPSESKAAAVTVAETPSSPQSDSADQAPDSKPAKPERSASGKRIRKRSQRVQRNEAAVAARAEARKTPRPSVGAVSGDARSIRVALTSEPPGAAICLPGVPVRVGATNGFVNLTAASGRLTLLLYRRGFHVEKVLVSSDSDIEKVVKLRPLSDDDLQAPPPCR